MKEKSQVRIFISYRRKGGIDTARVLHDQLKSRDYNVFLDMEGLRSGAFNTALYKQIESSDVFLIVLTKDCLKRCWNPRDWVRQELKHAFKCGLNVIPVIKDDFVWPNRLPQDINPLRNCQGLTISYQFFDAYFDKLEEYILNEPVALSYDPNSEPPVTWHKYAIAGAALAVLLAGVFLLGRGCTHDPDTSGRESPSQSTAAPQTTAPPAIEGQQAVASQDLGNSTGNQCNGGVASVGHFTMYHRGYHLNTLGEQRYFIEESTHTLRTSLQGEKSTEIYSDKDLDYFLATKDWIYYAITSGDSRTLYRTERPEGLIKMNEGEALISGISTENSIMIDGEYAYYWGHNTGIYRLNLATLEQSLFYELDATWTADTIGISGNWVYVMTENTITRIHCGDKRQETVFVLADHFTDEKLTAGNADDGWIYFAVTDLGGDGYHHNDRVYRMHTDGSEMERIFVADTSICRINRICITNENVHFDMDCDDGGHCHYYISLKTRKIIGSEMAHTEFHQETSGVTVGNTVTNLCNLALVSPQPGNRYMYHGSQNMLYNNHFSDMDLIYVYDASIQSIKVSGGINNDFKESVLVENKNCHYLYVTTDWLYCVLWEDGVHTLYRAQHNMEEHTIGELEPILTDIYASPNRLAIQGDKIYYWRKDKGLFTARTDGTGETLLYDNNGEGTCNGWITFHVNDEYLYFWVSSYGICSINLETSELDFVLKIDAQEGKLAHAVAVNGKFAYVVRHMTDNVVTAPDQLWIINEDGTDAKQFFVGTDSMHIQTLNAGGTQIYLKILEEGVATMYSIPFYGGSLEKGSTLD